MRVHFKHDVFQVVEHVLGIWIVSYWGYLEEVDNMRKLMVLSMRILLCLVLIMACGNVAISSEKLDGEIEKQLIFPSGPGGSGWYRIGMLFADLWMDKIDGMNVTCNEGNALSNISLVSAGTNADIGFGYVTDLIDAHNGVESFTGKPLKNVKALCTLFPTWWHIAVLESSSIKELSDLKGKHISPGSVGSGAEQAFRRILAAAGLSYNDMGKISFGSYEDGASMLQDGVVDAIVGGGSISVPAFLQLDAVKPIRIIPLQKDVLDALDKAGYGYDTQAIFPAGIYKGVKEGTPAISSSMVLFINDKLSDATGYALTKVIWDNLEYLRKIEPVRIGMMSLEMSNTGLPRELFNAGAAKYLEEMGVKW